MGDTTDRDLTADDLYDGMEVLELLATSARVRKHTPDSERPIRNIEVVTAPDTESTDT